MPLIIPKETIQKTYRFVTTQSEDLEKLAKTVGRTQNELIVMAVQELLYQNRTYFMYEVLQKEVVLPMINAITVRGNDYSYSQGGIVLNVFAVGKEGEIGQLFTYEFIAKNHQDVPAFATSGKVDVSKQEEFSNFIEQVLKWIMDYADVDDDSQSLYFRNYFASRS